MLMNICIAALMIILTTAIHAWGMLVIMKLAKATEGGFIVKTIHKRRVYKISYIVLFMFNITLLEVLAWALLYLALGAIDGIEKAFYFSMVTFTTLGYGDVLLDDHWRLLSSFEAANGIIMFGWTTALVYAAVHFLYVKGSHKEIENG